LNAVGRISIHPIIRQRLPGETFEQFFLGVLLEKCLANPYSRDHES